MTDERLRIAVPDDQVCEACQAVVLNMQAHTEWHARFVETAKSRIDGVERRLTQKITALQDQAGNYLGDHGGRLEQVEGALGRIESALPRVYARLSGVEDELTKREVNDVLATMNDEDRHTYDDERDDPDEGHVIVNMAGETVATVGERDEPPVQGNVVRNLTGHVVVAELEVADGIYRVVDARVRPLSVGPELPDGTYTVQGQRVIDIQPSFPQELATCEACCWSKGELTLCRVHAAVVDAARHETHAE